MEREFAMRSGRWEAIAKIFGAALEKPQSDREKFVRDACAGDLELESEVARLLAADEDAGSFLERPAISTAPPEFAPGRECSLLASGSLISGRFEILRFIGQGGMGQVYEALDRELKGRVALKAIREDISSDPRMLSRFRREVLLTRRITHPNVCRTFDIDRHSSTADDGTNSDITFLTMELLEGETLADLLRRQRRLTAAEALPLVLQMIQALGAAHNVGIVHRDFKPSNVLLVPSGVQSNKGLRVVVTDFGLARAFLPHGQISPEQAATSLTGSQGLMGTLVYMAPEQFERGEATVATDIYSLGLVMYEMVTGARPFADPIPFAEATKRIKQPAPSAKILAADLDPAWEATICSCLEAEPGARPASVQEVIEEINASKTRIPESRARSVQDSLQRLVSTGGIDHFRSMRWRKWTASVVLLITAVALLVAALRYYKWSPTVPDGASVLLTEVANQTSDQELDATTDVLLHELSQSAHFSVIEKSKIRAVLQQMARPYQQQLDPAMAREIAWRAGGALVVYGSITRLGPALSLDLRLERLGKQPKDSPRSWYKSFQANDKQDLFNAIRAGSQWIREMAGEGADSFAKERPPQDTTTGSWEALLLFSQAEQLKALDHTPEAIERLKLAVNADPEFALAWMRLGDLSNSIERDGDAFRFWAKALDGMNRHPLTKKEELRIKGLYASDTGDYATARQVFQEWEVLYPKDYLPSFYLAGALSGAGRYEEAIDKLNEAERKQPQAWYIAAQRSHCNLAMGRYDRLVPDLKRLRELGKGETVDLIEGALDFIHSDSDSALGHFRALSNSSDDYWKSLGFSIVASLLSEMGRYGEAKALLLKGVEFDATQSRMGALADKEIELAYLSFRTGDRESCRLSSLAAVAKEDGPVHLKAAGSMFARCGFPDEAGRLERRLKSMSSGPAFQIAQHRIAGEVFLFKGNFDRALVEFQAEASLESPKRPKDYLARALSSAGQQEEALKVYRQIVASPGQIWQEPDVELPGLWADALFEEGRLDSALHRSDTGLRQYIRVRHHSDPTFEEPKIARGLLQALDGPRVLQSIQ
jgi:eukaryotic-like serine/threonine-protein kinase